MSAGSARATRRGASLVLLALILIANIGARLLIEVRRRIGMVFQKPNPFPKSIYDNVAARVADRTAFFSLDPVERVGTLVEYADTDTIFRGPTDPRTRDYVTGRFG